MMQRALRPSALVPRGFDVESAICDGAATVITGPTDRLRAKAPSSSWSNVKCMDAPSSTYFSLA
jgi:hypothetical protein